MTSHRLGSVLADRYELLDALQGEPGTERYRALDRRLHREVLVEVERDAAAPVSTAAAVRTLAGADDTAMCEVLDGGELAGHHFVVRELPQGSFDDTAVLHAGPTTAVLAVAPVEPPMATAPLTDGGRLRRRAWLVGLSAVAVVAVVALALAASPDGGGAPSSVDPTSTSVTEAPTTTVPDVVSDPAQTDQLPGRGKKDKKENKDEDD